MSLNDLNLDEILQTIRKRYRSSVINWEKISNRRADIFYCVGKDIYVLCLYKIGSSPLQYRVGYVIGGFQTFNSLKELDDIFKYTEPEKSDIVSREIELTVVKRCPVL